MLVTHHVVFNEGVMLCSHTVGPFCGVKQTLQVRVILLGHTLGVTLLGQSEWSHSGVILFCHYLDYTHLVQSYQKGIKSKALRTHTFLPISVLSVLCAADI